MRILFQSYAFHPSCGGIESSALLFLREFLKAGHQLRLHTLTPLGDADELDLPGVPVRRMPGFRQVREDMAWAEVVYQHNPSLRLAFPFALTRRPVVISIRTWIRRSDGSASFADRLKLRWISRHTVIANSRATAEHLPVDSTVIENAYDDTIFHATGITERKGMVFVGRLVSDKGADLAVEALARLRSQAMDLTLTIVGDGPERKALEQLAAEKKVADAVEFVGRRTPEALATILNRHKYLLIPSRWEEPFGIVALEGIACGCVPLGTDQGGLVDAIGPCGPRIKRDDAAQLTRQICLMEDRPEIYNDYRSKHADHVKAHSPQSVASKYLEVFEAAIRNSA